MSPIERSSGGGGSAAAGLVKLFDSTLGVAAASIDTGANGVAGGHSHLQIMFVGQSDAAVVTTDLFIRFNNDSAANYDDALMRNGGGVLSALSDQGVTSAEFGQIPGTSGVANYAGTVQGFLPAYDQTSFFKSGTSMSGVADSNAAHVRMIFVSFSWRSTAAVTRVAVLANSGNLVAGSRLSIYGVQ